MSNDDIRNLIATLERESDRSLEECRKLDASNEHGRARQWLGRANGIQYAIGALEACVRDE